MLAMPKHVPTGMGLPHATPTQSQFSISHIRTNNKYSFVYIIILNPHKDVLYIDLLTRLKFFYWFYKLRGHSLTLVRMLLLIQISFLL